MTAWRHDLLNISLSKFPVTAEIGIKAAESLDCIKILQVCLSMPQHCIIQPHL